MTLLLAHDVSSQVNHDVLLLCCQVVDVPTGTVDVWVGLLMYLRCTYRDSGCVGRVVDIPTGTVDIWVGLWIYLQGQWIYG